MANQCKREPEAFLFAIGELGFLASVRALGHLAWCSVCRREARRLRGTSKQVAGTFGVSASIFPLKSWAIKGAWAAVLVIGSAGLYVAGERAVSAAMATLDRPRLQQATFENDRRPDKDEPAAKEEEKTSQEGS